ncbi:hypothetical protein MBLNU459_g3926t1 [Dothideomycetes sp. NU459]
MNQTAPAKGVVVVVGAGVIGITIALILQSQLRESHSIIVVARDFPPEESINYASMWAGAHVRPVPGNTQQLLKEGKWLKQTYDHFTRLIEEEPWAGVKKLEGIEYLAKPSADYISIAHGRSDGIVASTPGFRVLSKAELPKGIALGFRYDTFCVNSPMYCSYLLQKFRKDGGKTLRKSLVNGREGFTVAGDVKCVVNASGLGFGDLKSFPTRAYWIRNVSKHFHQVPAFAMDLLHDAINVSGQSVRSRLLPLITGLLEIESTSEAEGPIGLYLEKILTDLGYSVERQPISESSSRYNIYAYLGSERRARTCLSSHMDTVPPHINYRIAISPISGEETIYGRGSCDDKGPMAAQILALEYLREEGMVSDGDVSLLFVVGEEKGGPGMIAANNLGLSWEAVIFGEPTEGKLASGHKGHIVFEITTKGVPAHSGYPERGSSANSLMVKVLAELESLAWPISEKLGPSTFHSGQINGGVAYNVLAAECKALCAVRVAEDLPEIRRMIYETADRYEDVNVQVRFGYDETYLDCDLPDIATTPVSFGTDVPRLEGTHKKYLYGPGSILVAHGVDEQGVLDPQVHSESPKLGPSK